ncbi:MAG TPA: head GIN domain-containing protein [Chitinophagales bacterium]|nr:head GIN domain-containing protein [Chitinophagales bacterium]
MKNKLNLHWLLLLAIITGFYGCDCEKGSGNVITETRNFGYANKLQLMGNYQVYLYQDTITQVTIEAEDNIIRLIDTYLTTDGRLIIETDKCIRKHREIKITISMPDISQIRTDGSARIWAVSSITTNELKIETYGSGNLTLTTLNSSGIIFIDVFGSGDIRIDNVNAPQLRLKIHGTGSFAANGSVGVFDADIFGSGNVNTYGLTTEVADISIAGTGNCYVYVTNLLDVQITGSGNVYYRGSPGTVNIFVTGTGSAIAG